MPVGYRPRTFGLVPLVDLAQLYRRLVPVLVTRGMLGRSLTPRRRPPLTCTIVLPLEHGLCPNLSGGPPERRQQQWQPLVEGMATPVRHPHRNDLGVALALHYRLSVHAEPDMVTTIPHDRGHLAARPIYWSIYAPGGPIPSSRWPLVDISMCLNRSLIRSHGPKLVHLQDAIPMAITCLGVRLRRLRVAGVAITVAGWATLPRSACAQFMQKVMRPGLMIAMRSPLQ